MKKLKDIKLGTRLTGAFLAISIIPLVISGLLAMNIATNSLSEKAFDQLEAVREIKKNQIESYFSERIKDITVLANNPFTIDAVKTLDKAFDLEGGAEKSNFQGHANEQFDAPESYRKVHDQYFPIFKQYMEQYGYYDIFLMCTDHGDTSFTVAKESDFGQRADKIDSPLRDVWILAKEGKISISDTKPYVPSNNAPAQFIAAPIREKGEIIGILAFQISIDTINKIMLERSGMGDTGESYLIGQDRLMRSDSFLDPKNHSVIASFANPEKGSVNTEASNDLLSGKSGEKIIIDYNGNPVLSSFTSVDIGLTNWGLLVEIDKAEAFGPIKTLRVYIMTIILIAAVIIAGVAFFISRSISKPIIKGVNMAQLIAKGDLTQTLDIHQKDEVGILADALNSMSKNLRKIFSQIASDTQMLNSSSTELSAISEQISKNSAETADKSASVAAAAEEMSTNMNSVAAATEQTTTNIQMIVSASEQMSATINEIAKNTAKGSKTTAQAVQTAKEVSKKIGDLEKASAEINKVTETIADISEQTNLLALNATIEAARAGEAGKGFAVVAGEIKVLAQQTADATRDIKEKISGVQVNTSESITAIESIVAVITEVNEIVTMIAAAIKEQSATTQEITGNVSQAASGIQDVNENVSQTSVVAGEVTRDITAVSQKADEMNSGSQQINSSSAKLSGLAESLNEFVRQFKV